MKPDSRPVKLYWDISLSLIHISSFTECNEFHGGHLQPELIIVEFLDDNNQPGKEGEAGEVTITTLGVRGMPLLRFTTGDICYHYTEPCACGRNTIRLSSILGLSLIHI